MDVGKHGDRRRSHIGNGSAETGRTPETVWTNWLMLSWANNSMPPFLEAGLIRGGLSVPLSQKRTEKQKLIDVLFPARGTDSEANIQE